ncbi:MAG: hypothetical protein WBA57_05280 [Elainellaceae cyanobacterium]
MQIPTFPECRHPIVKELFRHPDQELLLLFQRYPERGKYFTAIFCRYSPIVYTLIRHSARSPVQADYLFATTWRHIYYELRGLDLREFVIAESEAASPSSASLGQSPSQPAPFNLQNWLISITAICINHAKLPPVESIHYSLADAPPPLWCYLEQALNQVSPTHRLAIVMAQTFHWSEPRIAAYFQAEGEAISSGEVSQLLNEGYQALQSALPDDIRDIYQMSDQASVPNALTQSGFLDQEPL